MEGLAGRVLPPYLDRPVIDKTGLTGLFDLHLEFSRTTAAPVILNGEIASPNATDPAGEFIFGALQKIGLKLSPDKGPIPVIVIDHVERPSEN
jgi:uncharacterized protein (TIGR03435 family)